MLKGGWGDKIGRSTNNDLSLLEYIVKFKIGFHHWIALSLSGSEWIYKYIPNRSSDASVMTKIVESYVDNKC